MEIHFLNNKSYLNLMKRLLTLLFVTSTFATFSQTWVSDNAVLHYDYWNVGESGFYKIQHTSDSVIIGKTCKQFDIEKHKFTYFANFPNVGDTTIYSGPLAMGTRFTYQSNDSVFHWDQTEFKLLFDFGAQVGDTWVISTQTSNFGCGDSSQVEVIGIGTEVINGTTYRYLDLASTSTSEWRLQGRYNERFARSIFPFARQHDCEGVTEWDQLTFKCFKDDDFALFNPSGEDCEYKLNSLSIEKLNPTPKTLVKIIDQLGKPAEYKPNTLLFYIYSDGSSEKIFRVE